MEWYILYIVYTYYVLSPFLCWLCLKSVCGIDRTALLSHDDKYSEHTTHTPAKMDITYMHTPTHRVKCPYIIISQINTTSEAQRKQCAASLITLYIHDSYLDYTQG